MQRSTVARCNSIRSTLHQAPVVLWEEKAAICGLLIVLIQTNKHAWICLLSHPFSSQTCTSSQGNPGLGIDPHFMRRRTKPEAAGRCRLAVQARPRDPGHDSAAPGLRVLYSTVQRKLPVAQMDIPARMFLTSNTFIRHETVRLHESETSRLKQAIPRATRNDSSPQARKNMLMVVISFP